MSFCTMDNRYGKSVRDSENNWGAQIYIESE